MIYKTKPFKHQKDAVKRFVDKPYGALFCEMGTGKTKIVLDIVQNAEENVDVVVIAPNGLHHNWAINEIPAHVTRKMDVFCWSGPVKTKKRKQELTRFMTSINSRIFLINVEALRTAAGYETLDKFLDSANYEVHMIVDESTCIKNPKAMQTKRVLKLSEKANCKWILNGTPITQSPLDLFSQCKFLHPRALPYPTYTAFKHAFAVEQVMAMGTRTFRKVVGYQNLETLTKLLEPFSLRIEKKDCLDLPEKVFIEYAIELTSDQKLLYNSLKEDCLAMLENGELITTTLALTRIIKLHQILTGFISDDDGTEHAIDNNRIAALMQIAETTQPLVVFCAYRHNVRTVFQTMSAHFGSGKVVAFSGDESSNQRNEAVRRFQAGEADFFVATSAAAKGLTLHRASTMVYYSNNYSLETRLQSQDRIHRIGQDSKCTYIDLVVPQTVDDAILKRLEEKKELSSMVLDDLIKIIK